MFDSTVTTFQILISTLLAVLATTLPLASLLQYIVKGWEAKRLDIMAGLDTNARQIYFTMFQRDKDTSAPADAFHAFDYLYTKWYGRRFFIAPGILFFAPTAFSVGLVSLAALQRLDFIQSYPLYTLPTPAIAAIAGAYLWVTNDFISRARRLDFSPADVYWATLRMVVAVPMGYAFGYLTGNSPSPFIAFALGAFPLDDLTTLLARAANKALGSNSSSVEASDDIIKLQGVNRTIVERLAKEDITTVTQIAYCDPVRLVMRSNLTFNFVTDCMSQGLVWMYYQDLLATVLRPLGLRGAVEIKYLMDAYNDDEASAPEGKRDHACAVAVVSSVATKLGQTSENVAFTFGQIAEDPFTVFICNVWT